GAWGSARARGRGRSPGPRRPLKAFPHAEACGSTARRGSLTSAASLPEAAGRATLRSEQNMARTAGCACVSGSGPISQHECFPPADRAIQASRCMNIQDTAKTKYAIGQPVPRKEDATLLRGHGRYTDDINLPGQAHAYMLRSSIAHGRIKSIDTSAAKAMKGVLAIITGEDVKAYGTLQSALPFKSKDGTDLKKPPRPALPTDKVRFFGDPIACVVAETLLQAKDAAEAINVDIEPLPVVTTPETATAPNAPTLFEEVPGNICLDFHYGD